MGASFTAAFGNSGTAATMLWMKAQCQDRNLSEADVWELDFAGCDNLDFEVNGCKINSSCNGFRFGCVNLLVKDCTFWRPGDYPHLVTFSGGFADRSGRLREFLRPGHRLSGGRSDSTRVPGF